MTREGLPEWWERSPPISTFPGGERASWGGWVGRSRLGAGRGFAIAGYRNDIAKEGVLLVGSEPLRNADEVFQVVASELGDRLGSVPDGETGPRADWIVWQYPVLSSRPEFEVCPPSPGTYRALPRLRVRDDESIGTLRVDDLGYAEAALSSFRSFAMRKRDGLIPD